jgi:hypothetical protein
VAPEIGARSIDEAPPSLYGRGLAPVTSALRRAGQSTARVRQNLSDEGRRAGLDYTAGIIRRHRKRIGSCWRKLNPGRLALLVLAYLRKGETFAELAAGFGIGTATAWRYVTETVALLAARSPKLRQALRDAAKAGHAYLVIDGT